MNARIIEINNYELKIAQNLLFGYAGEVWDAALVLTNFIINKYNKHTFSFLDKVVLELGSGTGICGFSAAMKNPKTIYITDKEIGLIKTNYEDNRPILPLSTEVIVTTLDWTKKEEYEKIQEKIDFIICSDIIWRPELYSSIIDTLDYYTKPLDTQILLSYQYRKKSDLEFFDKLKEDHGKWLIEMLPESVLDEDYRADDIMILRIIKLKQKIVYKINI